MSLIEDLRPTKLDEVVGQENAKRVVRTMIEQNKPDDLMLLGPSGTGKTTTAQIAARALTGKESPSWVAWDSTWVHFVADRCGDRKFIEERVQELSGYPGLRILVFDQAEVIPEPSQKLLLSLTERAERETYYFFCTKEPNKLIRDLQTRCQIAQFTWLNKDARVIVIKRG